MNQLNLVQAIFAGFCAYAFVTHVMIGLRSQPRSRVQLSFAFVSLCFGAAAVFVISVNQGIAASSAEEVVSANRWSLFFTFLAFAALVWFIVFYTGVEGRLFPVIISLALVAIGLSNFLVPYPGTYAYYSLEVGGTARQVAAEGLVIDWTPWYWPMTLLVNATFAVYAVYCAHQQSRRGERSQAIVLVISLVVLWAASLWDLLLVETGLVPVILMTQNGILAFLVIMSLRLSGQVVKAELEARQLNIALEERVEDRTAALKLRSEALQRSEERYALAQRAANIGSWDWNVLTGDLHWSEQIEPMFGFGPGEFGRTYEAFLDCVHPQDRQFVVEAINAAVNQGADYTIEHRIIWPDGTVRWVSETGDILRDREGQAMRMVGAVRDITARKQAETDLRARTRELGERVKELDCLYGISALIEKPGIALEEILQGAVDLIPPAWQYPEITCARIVMYDREFRSGSFRETVWQQASSLVVHGERSGRVEVYYQEEKPQLDEGPFLKEERNLLDAIAERICTVAERFQAEDRLHRRVEEMSTLHTVTQTVATAGDLSEGLASVAQMVTDLFAARTTVFAIPDTEGAELQILVGIERNQGAFTTTSRMFPLNEMPITRQVLEQGRSIVVPDIESRPLPTPVQASTKDLGLCSLLLVPLRVRGAVIGLLALGSDQPDRNFAETDIYLAETIAVDVAAALENARLAEQAQAAAVDAERQRLARELHDSVTQSLYSLTLLSNGWSTMAEQGRLDDPAGSFRQVGLVGQQALKEMRLLIHQLRPPILEEVGLVGALRQRLEAVEQRASVDTRLLVEGNVEGLPHDVEEQLFFIGQEALNNSLRHAAAAEVVVRVQVEGDLVKLSVQDDGVGYDPSAGSAGVGLSTMQERAEAINGRLAITSAAEEGTVVEVAVLPGREKGV